MSLWLSKKYFFEKYLARGSTPKKGTEKQLEELGTKIESITKKIQQNSLQIERLKEQHALASKLKLKIFN